ncbi:MDIS1-interacting receptor like kinase 2 [Camellia lanceoleosa]|uniref:MDIS1-interacting receptor like kinase 2 n=1 Tax=Camellia lanceoleosa TaxID=1840588 RepID=A0ACC0HNM0_9ERIC|nr:MDIS1-interacting receptor like kinase 2 [Camellia lanceoleosa]
MKVTEKCDVYSFGVLALEVIKGKYPGDFIMSLLTPAIESIQLKDVLEQHLSLPSPEVDEVVKCKIGNRIYRDEYRDKDYRRRSRSRSSVSPAHRSPIARRSPSPHKTPPSRGGSPDGRNHKERSRTPKSVSLRGRPADSRSPSRHSDADE